MSIQRGFGGIGRLPPTINAKNKCPLFVGYRFPGWGALAKGKSCAGGFAVDI